MLPRHALIGATFALLPLGQMLLGGGPAFTMYARLVEFRLELRGYDRDGGERPLFPSILAAALSPSARPFLTGAEEFRRVGDTGVLRSHLRELGDAACAREPALAEIDVLLVEREAVAPGHETRSVEHVRCRP